MIRKIYTALAIIIFPAAGFAAQPTLPTVFTDHMILQREQPVPVWGTADANSSVTVEFAGQKKTVTADADGKWKATLDPLAASSEPRILTVQSGDQQVSIQDVLVGEVWFCSGQSNMHFRMKKTTTGAQALVAADLPQLRLYETPEAVSITPVARQTDQTNNPVHNAEACWKVCTPENAGYFSGVAYYFGSKLHKDLNVPVGLLWASYGGSKIESWTPSSGFKNIESLNSLYHLTQNLPPPSGDVKKDKNIPTGLFNGMVYAHIPYGIRGVIWYQGESNHDDGMLYIDKTRALVNSWRELWGCEFPFYFVQIAPYQYDAENPDILPAFWEVQSEITKVIPKTGMVVINDAATLNDIHPPNKIVPGTRLALLAEADTYGMHVISSGPVFQTLEKQEGSLKVVFSSAEGLTTRDGKNPDWFEIAGKNGVFKTANARIDGNSVILSSPEVSDPVSMRFAWHKLAVPNLVNGAGLPASAFRAGTR